MGNFPLSYFCQLYLVSEILFYSFLACQMKICPCLRNHMHNSNQAKQIITSKAKNKSNAPAHLKLVLITVSRNRRFSAIVFYLPLHKF